MNQHHGLTSVDTTTDANPYCEPLTVMERIALFAIACMSLIVVFGAAGYLVTKFQ